MSRDVFYAQKNLRALVKLLRERRRRYYWRGQAWLWLHEQGR